MPNVTSWRESTLGQLVILALRDEVTGVIIVLFVVLVGNLGYKCRLNKQLTNEFYSSQECKSLVLCAVSVVGVLLFVPLV